MAKYYIKPRQHKYKAKPVRIDGHWFASTKEGNRYKELRFLEAARDIKDLKLQPRFPIVVNKIKICTYVADFKYTQNGREIVEDVKGCDTSISKLKRKLVKAIYEIDVLIT